MTKKLKIGFDAKRLFHNKEGLGAYARTLVSDLQKYYPQHTYYLFTPVLPEEGHHYFRDPSRFTVITPKKGHNRTWWRYSAMTKELQNLELDIYVGLSNELPRGISELPLKKVVVIHDLFHKTFPQQFSFINRSIIERKYRHALSAADQVVSISDSTARLIGEYYPESKGKLSRVYQSIAPEYRTDKISDSEGEGYFLMVGTTSERKNLEAMMQAYEGMEEGLRIPIKVVGRTNAYIKRIQTQLKAKGLIQYFDFLGHVSQDEMMRLYKEAFALVFPSHDEGFGRPILEAIQFKIPVIAYNRASIPEVLDKYGIIVEYDRTDALKEALENCLKKGFQFDYEGREEHLSKFDPELLSQLIMKLLSDVK